MCAPRGSAGASVPAHPILVLCYLQAGLLPGSTSPSHTAIAGEAASGTAVFLSTPMRQRSQTR